MALWAGRGTPSSRRVVSQNSPPTLFRKCSISFSSELAAERNATKLIYRVPTQILFLISLFSDRKFSLGQFQDASYANRLGTPSDVRKKMANFAANMRDL